MSTQVVTPQPPQMFPSEAPAYICSVYPGRLSHRMPVVSRLDEPDENGNWFTNITYYKLEPAPKDGYQVLRVWPTQEYVSVPRPSGLDGDLQPSRMPAPSSAELVRDSLVTMFRGTAYTGQGTHIGVGPIAGPVPTAEELKFLRDIQQRHFELLIDVGNQMWEGKATHELKTLQATNSQYRLAAEWLGIKLPWTTKWGMEGTIATKACLACGEPIQPAALACKHCGKDLVVFSQQRKWDAEKVRSKGDEATAAELEEAGAQAAAKQAVARAPVAPKIDRSKTLRENAVQATATESPDK